MDFHTKQQEKTYGELGKWLRELYGESVIVHPVTPSYLLRKGTAFIHITSLPWPEADDSMIRIISWLVRGPDIDADLMRFLLRENDDFRFGAFAVDKDGDLAFIYNMPGSTATKATLRAAVEAVAGTADTYDDRIVARWGGQTERDWIESRGSG